LRRQCGAGKGADHSREGAVRSGHGDGLPGSGDLCKGAGRGLTQR
jgi:hypothetical protein